MVTDSPRPMLPAPTGVAVSPAPTAEEAAAIVAAYEALWPRAAPAAEPPPARSAWRFADRWWSLPVPLRRNRPWRSPGT